MHQGNSTTYTNRLQLSLYPTHFIDATGVAIMTRENKDRLPVNITPFHYDVAIKTDVDRGSFEGKAVIQ